LCVACACPCCCRALCARYYCSCCITLTKVYLRLLLFLLYDTNEGLLKIITVRVICHWWRCTYDYYCSWCISLMKIYQRLLLFVLYVTAEGLTKIIIVRDICLRWQSWWKMIRLTGITVYNRTVLKNGSCCTVRSGKVSCLQKFRHFWMIIRDLFFESGSTEATQINKILQRYVIYISALFEHWNWKSSFKHRGWYVFARRKGAKI
jgi:hypothetical protein